ncbi:MAG: 3-phosphoshikimate 1-carboxyvinyltransferase [Fibrobacterota bacterium]
MEWQVKRSKLYGEINIPGSKSHTIRAVLIGTLSRGESVIHGPLMSKDGISAVHAANSLGADITQQDDTMIIQGTGGVLQQPVSLDMGNSGTATRLFTLAAALGDKTVTFDGDTSLRSRPMGPLLSAIEELGGITSCHGEPGYLPFDVRGPMRGKDLTIDGTTSQYLSSLLMSAPLLDGNTVVSVPHLNEKPYVEITLWWLERMGINFEVNSDFNKFLVFGGQNYRPLHERIPGDFSSATFAAVGAALTGGKVTIRNIDFSDPQGDRHVFDILEEMGVHVRRSATEATVEAAQMHGVTMDLNSMPDALPALAVLATAAEGETRIVNVAQARIKETDRISVMCRELKKMGARITEQEDGLVISKSNLSGTAVSGEDDHRVVMALTLAGMAAKGVTTVDTVEAADVTYPTFQKDFSAIGGHIQ